MKSFKDYIKEMTTGDVPVTQKGPYRNSGMLNPYIARRKPLEVDQDTFKETKPSKRQMRFEDVDSDQEPLSQNLL